MEQSAEQLAFNGVWRGLKYQGFERSVGQNNEQCRYRAPDGKKCAAGWLIRDEDYLPDMEGNVVRWSYLVKYALGKTFRQFGKKAPIEVIWDLQRIHDGVGVAVGAKALERELRKFAAQHGLTIPED